MGISHFRPRSRAQSRPTFELGSGSSGNIPVQSHLTFESGSGLKVRPHYAARQNATHCSFAARQKLLGICRQCDPVLMKKEFFADFQVTKTVDRDRRTWSDFFLKLADTILKPFTHHMPCGFF